MRLILVLVLALMCGCVKPTANPDGEIATPTKKALIVGINTYPGAPLSGCVNDANDMKDFLIKNYGYRDSEIKMLLNDKAKTADIIDGLIWLTQDAKAGDKRVFHYSGHGAEYAYETTGQPGNMNQVICPYDFDWTPGHMIMDIDFAKMFKEMPNGVIFNWVSDSCFSGDLTKELPKNGLKIVSKSYPNVPEKIANRVRLAKAAKKPRGMVNGVLDVGYVSGCRFDQTSADTEDVSGRPCGALTHFFLANLGRNLTVSLRMVVTLTDESLAARGYEQVPQAEGARIDRAFQE